MSLFFAIFLAANLLISANKVGTTSAQLDASQPVRGQPRISVKFVTILRISNRTSDLKNRYSHLLLCRSLGNLGAVGLLPAVSALLFYDVALCKPSEPGYAETDTRSSHQIGKPQLSCGIERHHNYIDDVNVSENFFRKVHSVTARSSTTHVEYYETRPDAEEQAVQLLK